MTGLTVRVGGTTYEPAFPSSGPSVLGPGEEAILVFDAGGTVGLFRSFFGAQLAVIYSDRTGARREELRYP